MINVEQIHLTADELRAAALKARDISPMDTRKCILGQCLRARGYTGINVGSHWVWIAGAQYAIDTAGTNLIAQWMSRPQRENLPFSDVILTRSSSGDS